MFTLKRTIIGLALAACCLGSQPAEARLAYTVHATSNGDRFVLIAGSFEFGDNLSEFRELVARRPSGCRGLRQSGRNVAKAMELGRLIRSLGLSTIQVRSAECASACSLVFLGDVSRLAEPGSIGVHKSSFSDTQGMQVGDAVSAVQLMTADVVGYMTEMGADPSLLQLSLSYESNDIRYLSGSEMSRYRVTTPTLPPLASADAQDVPASRATQAPASVQAKASPRSTYQSLGQGSYATRRAKPR